MIVGHDSFDGFHAVTPSLQRAIGTGCRRSPYILHFLHEDLIFLRFFSNSGLDPSPVVVIGRVVDERGTARNLRRDAVEVIQVLKGDVKGHRQIKVAFSERLQAMLANHEEYVFALAPSSSKPASFYGMIDPLYFSIETEQGYCGYGRRSSKGAISGNKFNRGGIGKEAEGELSRVTFGQGFCKEFPPLFPAEYRL
jgi:hypothetical protein